MSLTRLALLLGTLMLCGCSAGSPPATGSKVAGTVSEAPLPVSFVNRVWVVSRSATIQPGMLYVFLSDGTLVMTAPHSMPALGTWAKAGAGLTMVEESIPYAVDILKLTRDEFTIRSHNPGEPVDITLIPAEEPLH